MPKILLSVTLMFIPFGQPLLAQDDGSRTHQLRIGVGPSLYPMADLPGFGGQVSYAFSLNEQLALAPRIMSVSGNERTNTGFQTNSSLATALALRLTPFPNVYDGGKIDVGPLYHRLNTSTGRYAQVDGSSLTLPTAIRKSSQHLFGMFTALSFGIINGPRMIGGLEMAALSSFQMGQFSFDVIQAGIFLGFRF